MLLPLILWFVNIFGILYIVYLAWLFEPCINKSDDDDDDDDDDDEIQAVLYRKTKHPFEAKICVKMSFQLL